MRDLHHAGHAGVAVEGMDLAVKLIHLLQAGGFVVRLDEGLDARRGAHDRVAGQTFEECLAQIGLKFRFIFGGQRAGLALR